MLKPNQQAKSASSGFAKSMLKTETMAPHPALQIASMVVVACRMPRYLTATEWPRSWSCHAKFLHVVTSSWRFEQHVTAVSLEAYLASFVQISLITRQLTGGERFAHRPDPILRSGLARDGHHNPSQGLHLERDPVSLGHPRAEAPPTMRGPAKDLSSLGGLGCLFVWPSATNVHPQTPPPPPMMKGPWKGRPGPLIMGVGVP